MTAEVALVAATALHVGFQLVVSLLVYPAFAEVPAEHWPRYHAAHSRRISVVVALVYAAVLAASVWVLVAGPRSPATLTAVGASVVALLVTAFVAAPAHARLGSARGQRDLGMLVRADRVRLVAAVVALSAALVAVGG